jgi:RNA polymerase sigma-70 factor (ECF subfamily)
MIGGKPVNKGTAGKADERLLIEAAQKDPDCFAELYEANFFKVYAFVLRRVRSRDEAEDVTAEVFQKALDGLPRFKWRGAPFAVWLFRIAANMIVDRGKRAARENGTAVEDTTATAQPVDLEEVEYRARLFELVDQLPPLQRRVIVMRFAEEKSINEIAEDLGRTEGAVKQLQFRGLQSLRSTLVKING